MSTKKIFVSIFCVLFLASCFGSGESVETPEIKIDSEWVKVNWVDVIEEAKEEAGEIWNDIVEFWEQVDEIWVEISKDIQGIAEEDNTEEESNEEK